VLLAVFAVTFVIYAISPVRQNYDSYLAFPTAYSIVHDGDLYLDEFDAAPVVNHEAFVETEGGHMTNFFPWVPALALVPAVVALDVAGAVGIGDGSFAVANGGSMDVIQQLTASFVIAITTTLLVVVLFDRFKPSTRARLTVAVAMALLFAFGTAAWSTASRAVWQHGPSMLLLAAAVLMLQRLRIGATTLDTRLVAAAVGASTALSYTVRPTNAVVVVGITLFVLVSLRSALSWYALGAGIVGALWIAVNWATYRSILPSYNTASRLSLHDSYPEAIAANLFSPARGLILFSPIVVFSAVRWTKRIDGYVRPSLRRLDVVLFAIVVAYLLSVSALSSNWWAGHSFGPRFMSDPLVLIWCLIAPLAPWVLDVLIPRDSRPRSAGLVAAAIAVGVTAVWGVVVNAEGGMMRSTLCWNGEPNVDENVGRIWSLSDAQITSGFRAVADEGIRQAFLTRCLD
jgi:hypothetical protein